MFCNARSLRAACIPALLLVALALFVPSHSPAQRFNQTGRVAIIPPVGTVVNSGMSGGFSGGQLSGFGGGGLTGAGLGGNLGGVAGNFAGVSGFAGLGGLGGFGGKGLGGFNGRHAH